MSYSQHELAHFSWGCKNPKKSKKKSQKNPKKIQKKSKKNPKKSKKILKFPPQA
jgi:hypothetical protein